MARNDSTGELPRLGGEWQAVESALRVAREMARSAVQALRSVRTQVIQQHLQSDPRLGLPLTARQSEILAFVAAQFRLTNLEPGDIMNLADLYQNLLQRLNRLTRSSFRMVTAAVAAAEPGSPTNGETVGYVRSEQPDLIYLNETKFSFIGRGDARAVPPPNTGGSSGRRRGTVVGGEVQILSSISVRGAAILHEAVHSLFSGGAAGAVHRARQAGEPVEDYDDGRSGFSQIRTFSQAIMDAYAIERFARAVYDTQAAGAPERSSVQSASGRPR